jgi:hypothetical protein
LGFLTKRKRYDKINYNEKYEEKNMFFVIKYPQYSTLVEQVKAYADVARFIGKKINAEATLVIPRDVDFCELNEEDLIHLRKLIDLVLEDKKKTHLESPTMEEDGVVYTFPTV